MSASQMKQAEIAVAFQKSGPPLCREIVSRLAGKGIQVFPAGKVFPPDRR